MNAEELARLVNTWADALTLAELVDNPFLRVTGQWDLHDWRTLEAPDGLRFQRVEAGGHVVEEVRLLENEDGRVVVEAVREPAGCTA
jgi:hypothetical protein